MICARQSSKTFFLHGKWSSDALREGDFLVAVNDIIAEMKGITGITNMYELCHLLFKRCTWTQAIKLGQIELFGRLVINWNGKSYLNHYTPEN